MSKSIEVNKSIRIQILEYNYWEHFKSLKDIALIVAIDDPKRMKLQNSLDEILAELQQLKNNK